MRLNGWIRTGAASIAVLALVGSGTAHATPARPRASSIETAAPKLVWKTCKGTPKVQCAKVKVPVDWSDPDGPKISIALARRKAGNPDRRIGSLLVNPGGPGGSGVDTIKGSFDKNLPASVRARFDIVGFDPRGVGASSPLLCPPSRLTAKDFDPRTPQQFAALRATNRKEGLACAEPTGPVFGHLDNKSVVRDMDVIRAALGEAKLTYYGISYGTLMGAQYAQMFPDKVRALALDSVMDHSQSTAREFLVSETRASQDAFDQYAKWCSGSKKCLVRKPGARKVFGKLYSEAVRGKLLEPGTKQKILPLDLVLETQYFFASPAYANLSERHRNLLEGRLPDSELPARTAGWATEEEALPAADDIFCSDWNLPLGSYNEFRAIRREMAKVAPDMRANVNALASVLRCQGWPNPATNPQEPLTWEGVPPVLLLNTRHDPATPYSWARNVARQTGATLLTYAGAGHGVYAKKSPCLKTAVAQYLLNRRVPAAGTVCRDQ